MTLLAGTLYDPAAAVSKATSSLLAMTAIDTTNLRLTFTVPANGKVVVRMQCNTTGATTFPRILLGVLQTSTVMGRVSPIGHSLPLLATDLMGQEAYFVVSGLTPGASLMWDAAYGVEVIVASTNIKYGGPNDASGADAWGGFAFEIYDCINLLASATYDPTTAVTVDGSALKAMTAFDTTNLRLPFPVPPSGRVLWHVRVPYTRGGTLWGSVLLGVKDSAGPVKGRVAPTKASPEQTNALTSVQMADASGVVTGLAPGTSLIWDAAYAIQVVSSTNVGTFKYGGPNNAVSDDAWGAAIFNIWAV